jgi:hypothetical protein
MEDIRKRFSRYISLLREDKRESEAILIEELIGRIEILEYENNMLRKSIKK